MELTKEQIKKYLDSGGDHCPVCKSNEISENLINYDNNYRNNSCDECDATWTEEYKLIGVELSDKKVIHPNRVSCGDICPICGDDELSKVGESAKEELGLHADSIECGICDTLWNPNGTRI